MIIKDLYNYIHDSLINKYPKTEIQAFYYIITENIFNYTKLQLVLNHAERIDEEKKTKIDNIISQLIDYVPIQYIFEKQYFYNMYFFVNPDVLIPRPETEELVDIIVNDFKDNNQQINILDIGTGTGCIAIALNKNIRKTKVYAIDISEKALKIAELNNKLNKAEVVFYQLDILNFEKYKYFETLKFDIIVSNPPYIKNSEKAEMLPNVLNYEPHRAIFVDDDNAYLFYEAIAKFSQKYIAENGVIYLEINDKLATNTCEVFKQIQNSDTKILTDINEKNRFIKIHTNI